MVRPLPHELGVIVRRSAYFHIIYDGPALENNEMDVKELAPSLIALSETIEEANKIINHGKAKIVLNVRASFKTGCFGIDLHVVQSILTNMWSLFKHDDVQAAVVLLSFLGFTVKGGVGGIIGVLKWIKDRKITKIQINKEGMATIIIDNDKLEVEQEVVELLKSFKLRQSLEKAIAKPLENEGIYSISTTDTYEDKKSYITINKSEKDYFRVPEVEDEILEDKEYITNLQIVSAVFQENNKWRFSEGMEPFYAEVKDEIFSNEVQNSERSFSKGDILTVKLKKVQKIEKGNLKSEYEILKVLNHRSAFKQIKLPFDEG